MNISKCKTCVFYEPFFNSCNLNQGGIYLGEGDFDVIPTDIKYVITSECEYQKKAVIKYDIQI